MVDIQEFLLLINLTMMYAVSYHSNESVFCIVTNVTISLALIQFCALVLHHFLTYTYRCNTAIMLQTIKLTMTNLFTNKTECQYLNDANLLEIPERTYNYTEYQDGLISDDFQ